MRALTLFLALIVSLSSFSGEDLAHFRVEFEKISSYETADSFLKTDITENNFSNSVTIKSYKAVCKMMMAQYVYNPFSKYSWFNEGKAMLEETIGQDKNVENVYLRLIVQLNTPSFLGYNTEISSDTKFIKDNLEKSTIPDEVKKYILKNLINTGENAVDSLRVLAEKYSVV